MKNHRLRNVIGLYEALLRDLQYIDTTIYTSGQDLKILRQMLQARGEAFFTIALPDIGKFLERGLSDGALPEKRPHMAGALSASNACPRLFNRLWLRIFDEDGVLRPSPCTSAIAGLRQLLLAVKKLRSECSEERVQHALLEFLEVDKSLPPSHPFTWDHDHPLWVRRDGHPLWGRRPEWMEQQGELYALPLSDGTSDWDVLRTVAGIALGTFGPELDVLSLEPKHGPGAVAESTMDKYRFLHWPQKLDAVFPSDWFASFNLEAPNLSEMEPSSRVLHVPKTMKGPRIIAAEPISHQWCQGAIERWLIKAVSRSILRESIDFRRQDFSQCFALEASRHGHSATVDLSAASDRLSTRLVEYIFQSRQDILNALHATRTRSFQMPDGTVHRANKFACMGSACTFPVQTIVFTIFAVTAVLVADGSHPSRAAIQEALRGIQVFGDDIILPVHAYETLVNLLTEAGLKVNADKSHHTGLFREACGMDAYAGVDVTPAYFLESYDPRKPESLVSVVASSNNFHEKGFWHAAAFLLNTVDSKVLKNLRVAIRDVSQPCIFSFAPSEEHLNVRFNPATQVIEVRAAVIDVKVDTDDTDWECLLLQFFFERGSYDLLQEVLMNRERKLVLGPSKRPKLRLKLRWVLQEDRG